MPGEPQGTYSCKEVNGTSVYDVMKETFKRLDTQPACNFIKNPEISKLRGKYQNNFSKVSHCFENFAKNRRRTIEKLSQGAQTIENTRQNCYKAILTFSSLSIMASTISLLLINVNKSWSAKSFVVAATVGSFSFVCSLIDVFVSKSKAEQIELTYQEDKFTLDDLEREIQFGALFNDIHDFFPNGVNYKIVKNMIEPQLMNRKEWSHFKTLFDEMDAASDDEKIFYAIVLSNILSDPDLLQDTYFLAKVQVFSKSTLAEKWWNRLKYENSSHHSEKMKLLSEIKSFLKLDKLFISGLSIVVFPISYDMFINAAALAFVNCIIIFDVFNELKIQLPPKESSTFRRLEHVLRTEYNELKKVYDLLNPYND